MAVPTTRSEFSEYCLRRLGKPVINIDVTTDQVDDRVDDALKLFRDYHFDGSNKYYLKHQITDQDKINKYITVPEDITGISRIFSLSGISPSGNIFDVRYQIALNDLYTLTSVSMTPYFMTMQHLSFLETLLVGEKPIRFNRYENKLFVDTDWNKLGTGQYILAECLQAVDPEEYSEVWSDPWLADYTTQLIKQQWGENIKKFGGMQMPGGIVFNGDKIWQEAEEKIQELRQRLKDDYTMPLDFLVG